ncbi:MAG: TIGR03862 family flavoprotein [Candidatus Protistobacter heckmanni]|nr:TIGR03862 family flavoprotein [Candidatus Protistobacter heckmanni]
MQSAAHADGASSSAPRVAIVGGGPAGLMAAETLAAAGLRVDLYDAMPSVGRKFLLAGKGGMNLTHSEALEAFLGRYGVRREALAPLIEGFGPQALRDWARGLGVETFVGSSGRIFPNDMKAAPLLRAWLHRLREAGVRFHMRHRWLGWAADGRALRFATPLGETEARADAVLLALGGGSWARLGSDGAWQSLLAERGVPVKTLEPSNCGFEAPWSEYFRERFAGQPVKSVAMSVDESDADAVSPPASAPRQGEFVVSASGVEGSLVYALSARIRERIAQKGIATIRLDLLPGLSLQKVQEALAKPRGKRSLSSHLQSQLGIAGVKAGLLRESLSRQALAELSGNAARFAAVLKSLPVKLLRARPLDEAISSAGGVPFEALDRHLMLKTLPGVFCAGEMLDWDAPTGGYLLTACFASGRAAGAGLLQYLAQQEL